MQCLFNNNQVSIDIEVLSPLSTRFKTAVTAKIDTGFSGDLQLTHQIAFPLGLTLLGYQSWTLADGNQVTFLECVGIVSYAGKKIVSSIDVKPSGSILIGMSLLKKLGCEFKINFVTNIAEINISSAALPSTTPAQPPSV